MNEERVSWQADDPESGAVQVAGRPVHALWSTLREHFRRVLLEPHRPAGSDKVGWRWLGGGVPKAPERTDLADLRQLLQHALLDLTAELERREENAESASPKELLAAMQSIVHDLSEGTDIDLGTYAVETANGWFIRSWGFSQPAPAKLADATEPAPAPETPAAPEAPPAAEQPAPEAPAAAEPTPATEPPPPPAPPPPEPAPPEPAPVKRRRRLGRKGRWLAGAAVLLAAVAVFVWIRSRHQPAPPATPPPAAVGEAPEAEPHQGAPPHAPAAEAPAPNESVTAKGGAPSAAGVPGAPPLTSGHADAPPASVTSHAPVPGAHLGVMPVLPGQTGELASAPSPTSHAPDAHSTESAPGESKPAPPPPATPDGPGGADAPHPEDPAKADSSSAKPEGGHETADKPGETGTAGPAAVAPSPPARTPHGDAGKHPELPPQPAIAPQETAPEPEPTAPTKAPPPSAAPPPPAPASASEASSVQAILWGNQNVPLHSPPPPAPLLIFMPGAPVPAEAPNPTATPPAAASTNEAAGTSSGQPGTAAGAGISAPEPTAEEAEAAAAAAALAAAKAKFRAASFTVFYRVGDLKVRLLRDTVLTTQPTEQASRQMIADARLQAWSSTQAAKPESFRKPVIQGGWTFRPARGATWAKPPIWLDPTTGKPVKGLQVSTNGLNLNWTGLVPEAGFSAHILDEDGNEQARLSYRDAERGFEVTIGPVFKESAPVFRLDLTARESVAGAMVWSSQTPTWSDSRWETERSPRQIGLTCLQALPRPKAPLSGVVALSHPASGWVLSWEVALRPTATPAQP